MNQIKGTVDAWENGELGRDAAYVVRAPVELEQQVEDALGMQSISIRLHRELIEEFKMIAQFHKVGYQPLMRDALKRFAEYEIKKMAVEYANERAAKAKRRQTKEVEPATESHAQAHALAA